MNSIRKWFYKPKKEDNSKLAQFYWADEELNMVATELDSFDGQKDPERCSALVDQLRLCQDKVLGICNSIMDEAIPDLRAYRDFRVKFPDDILQENLAGQLWFGAECLAAGSNLMNRELESASMRPLAKALTKALDHVRWMLREQCIKNPLEYSDKLKEALVIFDRLFAEFEFCYVSALVPVKSAKEYHLQQEVVVLFSETLQRALKLGLVNQEMVDDYDPSLMFTIPRLAIVCGLLVYPEGPLNVDRDPTEISELFRPFYNLLFKIRDLLWTLSRIELHILEKTLCSLEDPQAVIESETTNNEEYPVPDSEDYIKLFYQNHQNCKQFIHDFYAFNFGPMSSHQDDGIHSLHNKFSSAKTKLPQGSKTLDGNDEDMNISAANRDDVDAKTSLEELPSSDVNATNNTMCVCSPNSDDSASPSHTNTVLEGENEPKPDPLLSSQEFRSLENILNPNSALMESPVEPSNRRKSELDSSSTETKSQESVCIVQDLEDALENRTQRDSVYTSVAHDAHLNQTFHLLQSLQQAQFNDQHEYTSSPEAYTRLLRCSETSRSFPQPGLQLCYGSGRRTAAKLKKSAFPKYCRSSRHSYHQGVVCDNSSADACCSSEVQVVEGAVLSEGHQSSCDPCQHPESAKNQQSLLSNHKHSLPCPIPRVQRLRHEAHASSYSSCSSCRSSSSAVTSEWDTSSCPSSATSSYKSECQDDEEIALALQAAEIASRNEARARFKNSSDLVHRLFVCISGVADQLQTNYASDLRNILKCVFDMNCSNAFISSPKKSLGDRSDSETEGHTLGSETSESDYEREPSLGDTGHPRSPENTNALVECPENNIVVEESQTVEGPLDSLSRDVERGEEAVPDPALFSDDDGSIDGSPIEERGVHFRRLHADFETYEEPPKWLPDELTDYCMACQSPFTLLRRRHHCRNCGKIFCSRCSSNSIPLPQYGHLKPVRVCNRCFSSQLTPLVAQEHPALSTN